ncbi:MAG: hypothetical protein ACFFG0_47110 [Candidatus Thorarchaeota archaeon]
MDIFNLIEIIVLTATLIIIWYFSFKQIKELKNQIWINTFLNVTRRYQEIISKIPLKYYNENLNFSEEELMRDMELFRSYFNLCSEEFILKESGNIKEEIWEKWLKEMEKLISFNSFREVWKLINKVAAYDNNFINFYNNLMINDPRNDQVALN